MADSKPSSYLQYLPPVVWSNDEGSFLGRFLLGFEKILTGLDDGVEIIRARDRRVFRPLEKVVDTLPDLFNPRHTPAEFLDWLATWVALEPPPNWDDSTDPAATESRKRSVISSAAGLYKQRWRKAGLYAYLATYAADPSRPRIAIDDGEALIRVKITADGSFRASPLGFSRVIPADAAGGAKLPWLLHPTSLAVTADATSGAEAGSFCYVVADDGVPGASRQAAVWRVDRDGRPLDWAPTPGGPLPRPVNADDFPTFIPPPGTNLGTAPPFGPVNGVAQRLRRPVAVAADVTGKAVYVLDRGDKNAGISPALYRYNAGPPPGRRRRPVLRPRATRRGRPRWHWLGCRPPT